MLQTIWTFFGLLAPMTTHRSPLFELADTYVDTSARMSPMTCTDLGIPGYDDQLDTFTIEEANKEANYSRDVVKQAKSLNPTDEIDRISQANIQSMLETLRAYQTQSGGTVNTPESTQTGQVQQPTFFNAVQSALDRVNDTDRKADAMADAYERGEEVPLTDVVLAMQKSSLAFEATLQVRNKVMKAYEEIMNMPV